MNYRQQKEKQEENLFRLAARARENKGRHRKEEPCEFRTDFQRDRDRIIYTKAFRRLMHKTQVFILQGDEDHHRTRLTHTIEVSQVARTIARALNINEDLAEAIAYGHDLGHTPFGHSGEAIIDNLHPAGFKHAKQSLKVVDVIERHGDHEGLNLTDEVRDGIVHHNGQMDPYTLEGQAVKISDRIAYLNHDIDDALRSGVIQDGDIPKDIVDFFGNTHGQRMNTMVKDVIENSLDKSMVLPSAKGQEMILRLRKFMFERVYLSDKIKTVEKELNIEEVITFLYNYFIKNPKDIPLDMRWLLGRQSEEETAKDYIAGMTDRYALSLYSKLTAAR